MEKRNLDKKLLIKSIAFYFVFILINYIYFTRDYYSSIQSSGNFTKYTQMLIIAAILGLIYGTILLIINMFKFKEHHIFFIIALLVGITFITIIPIGNGNDEMSHFLRIYEITEKYTSSNFKDDSSFPPGFESFYYFSYDTKKYSDYISNYSDFNTNSEEVVNMNDKYWNTKMYAPIQYLPQIIGIIICKLFTSNILIMGYCGRIFGFIFWLFFCTLAVKLVPDKKLFFITICLLPINIVSAICLSGDTITNAIILLFIAIIYKMKSEKEIITTRSKVLLFALCIVISLCKVIYLPFIFILFLLDKNQFNSKKDYFAFIIFTIIMNIIIGGIWFAISLNVGSQNTNTSDQIKYMLRQPIDFLTISIRTLYACGERYILEFTTGQELFCNGKLEIYGIFSYIIGLICIISIFTDEKSFELSKIQNLLVIFIIVLTAGLIFSAEYVQWTSQFGIGHFIILGIQGRYFIPIFMLLCFINNKVKISGINNQTLINFIYILEMPIIYQTLSFFL